VLKFSIEKFNIRVWTDFIRPRIESYNTSIKISAFKKKNTNWIPVPLSASQEWLYSTVLMFVRKFLYQAAQLREAQYLLASLLLIQILEVITRILWISKVCYHVHNCQTPVPILSHISPVHCTAHCLCNVHCNITLLLTYRSVTWPLSLRFPNQIPHTSLVFRISNTDLTLPSSINFFTLKVNGDKCTSKLWSSSTANYQQPCDTYFFTSKYSPLHPIFMNFQTFSYQRNTHSHSQKS
jgi:hypothetical protein